MEILRYTSNVYGQTSLEGVSWDLIGVFFGVGMAFIVLHGLYMWLFAPKKNHS